VQGVRIPGTDYALKDDGTAAPILTLKGGVQARGVEGLGC
jgi:hypothetical protein